ncbi:ABC transporter substrate-binding protein [Miniphocaeibacter halophilus]|uniref:ABC transporter substrate-binding protein n=1 Tax=Miniphocaeibacter halophilus TaxID=2931922 RepID=A0AC61MNZ2_9FIRM|nr:ABC transporter substrate-binding protein [Miniphocaeibacter halophilus]QQK07209.1 ABC transporter substrate-binding protein [Miniphocaeibacter halophilus]
MKKICRVGLLIALLMFTVIGCSNNSSKTTTTTGTKTNVKETNSSDVDFTIGIAQLAEHPALDSAREGFIDGLDELGVSAKINYSNAQQDASVASQIVQKYVGDKVDLIYSIATPTTQAAQQATADSEEKTPVLFSAVTDAVKEKLVESNEKPGGNITGTLDEAPMKEQLSIFKEIDDSIENIGIIYNTSERNSEVQIEQAKELEDELGIKIIEIGVNSINDVTQALQSKVKELDGIYTITDNMIASSISIISEIAIENKLVTVGAEEAHVQGGILISNGISYYELGKQTAEMAKKILVDGLSPKDIPVEKSKTYIKNYNIETLKALDLNEELKVFEDATEISAE